MSLLLFVGLCLASASAAAAALRCFGVGPMVGCSAIALSFIDFAPLTSEKLEHQDPDKAIICPSLDGCRRLDQRPSLT